MARGFDLFNHPNISTQSEVRKDQALSLRLATDADVSVFRRRHLTSGAISKEIEFETGPSLVLPLLMISIKPHLTGERE